MPKRSISHQLETKSLLALQSRIPSTWVFREEHPDYGIDGSIEVFLPDGSPTGLRCWVQIKSTAKTSRRPRVRLRVDTGKYFQSMDLPILIVLYETDEDRLFARWFHEFDPFYGGLGEKTLTFSFRDENVWGAQTPEMLARDLQVRRILSKGAIPLPIPFEIGISGTSMGDMPTARALHSIRQYLRRCHAILKEQDGDAALWIRGDGEKLTVSFRGAHSSTLHYSDTSSLGNKLGADVMVMIAVSISMAGDHSLASTLASSVAGESLLLGHPETFLRLVNSLASSQQPGLAFEMAEKMYENPDTRHAADTFFISGMLPHPSAKGQVDAAVSHLRRRIEKIGEGEETETLELGTAVYNLANQLRSMGRYRESLQLYRRAGQIHPPYCDRDYYWREIASLLFGAGFYSLSAELYARATAMGGPASWKALYADALMYAGRFAESRDAFDEYLTTEPDSQPEWVLKRLTVGTIVDQFGSQVRRSTRAAESAFQMRVRQSGDALEVLRLDPLSVNGWLQFADISEVRADRDECVIALVIAAVLAQNHPALWAQALINVLTVPGLEHLIEPVAFAAYDAVGDRMDESLDEFLSGKELPDEGIQAVYAFIQQLHVEYDRQRKPDPFELRLTGNDSSYSSLFFGGQETDELATPAEEE